MNLVMMFLTDCISATASLTSPSNKDLYNYILNVGEICELRAVAFKDVSQIQTQSPNLFKAWLITTVKKEDIQDCLNSVSWRANFIDYIEELCKTRLNQLDLKHNTYHDEK